MQRKLELLFFVINTNIKRKFVVKGIVQKGLILALLSTLIIFYGVLAGKGFHLLITKEIFSKEYLTIGFGIFLGLMIIFKDIFPSFKSIYYIDNSYYPINISDHYLLSKTNEFSNAYTFLILLFSTVTYLFSDLYTIFEYLQMYFVILYFKGLNYSFRMLFFNKTNLPVLLYLTSCLSNLVACIYWDIDVVYLLLGILIQSYLGFWGFKTYFTKGDIAPQIVPKEKHSHRIFLLSTKYFFSDKMIKKNMLTFVLVKIILLTIVSIGGDKDFFSSWRYIAKLTVLPILPFTYIINNIFGYTTSLYRNICLSEKIYFNLLASYLAPIFILIIIDFLSSFIVLHLPDIDLFAEIFKIQIIDLSLSYYIAYLCSIPFLLNIAVYFSLSKYKPVLKAKTQKVATNFWGSILSILIAFSIIILLEQDNSIILSLSAIIIALSFIFLLIKNIKGFKRKFTRNFLINSI